MNSSSEIPTSQLASAKFSAFFFIGIILVGVFCSTFGYIAGSYQLIPKIVEKIQRRNDVACTMEAKLCPDGSYVGRSGPKCEFSPCPKRSPTLQDTCTTNDDCRLVLNNAWNDCSLLNSCEPVDYRLDTWIAVNGNWFDTFSDTKCPDLKMMGKPACDPKPINDHYEAVCVSKICQKQPIGLQPTEIPLGEKLQCTFDSDCVIDTCGCHATNKKYRGANICEMACNGTASCLEGTCQFIHFPD